MEDLAGNTVHKFILFTEICDAARLHAQHPEQFEAAIGLCNNIVREATSSHRGQVYKTTGTCCIALFDTAHDCILCALSLQLEFLNIPPLGGGDRMLSRLSAHGGDLTCLGRDYFGAVLNRASRICQLCHPGQVLLSGKVKSAAQSMPELALLTDLGQHGLRDLSEPEQLFQLNHRSLPGQKFPPLSSLGNKPNNLRAIPDLFVGRAQELAELMGLLKKKQRLISIIALGGYGKSRLASHLLADLLPKYERGAFFVELAQVDDATGIPIAAAQALGFGFDGKRPPDEQVLDYLREKEILLCFDNFEHVLTGRAFVAEILANAPKVSVIVTSREPLHIQGEQVFILGPLPVEFQGGPNGGQAGGFQPADALLLFTDRASLVDREFRLTPDNAGEVAAICRLLSGIPLAIKLAAAWMDSFTLAEMAQELSQQLELEARYQDTPGRHRSLRASLDWSWKLLNEDQRETLMRFSSFRGGTFHEAASAVLDLQGMQLRRSLAKLMDKSWLSTQEETWHRPAGWVGRKQVLGQTRWHLRDEPSRNYAFGKLESTRTSQHGATGQSLFEISIMAHAAYFSGLAASEGTKLEGAAGHGQAEALAVFEVEYENITLALENLLQCAADTADGTAQSVPIEDMLLPIARWLRVFLGNTGRFKAQHTVYQRLSDGLARSASPELAGWATAGLCEAKWRLGHAAEEQQLLMDALANCKAYELHELEAWACIHVGTLGWSQGQMKQAREDYERALAICSQHGLRPMEAAALNGLGNVCFATGQYQEADASYGKSLAIRVALGDRRGEGGIKQNLGGVQMELGELEKGRDYFEQSLELLRELGDLHGECNGLLNLGILYRSEGNLDQAGDCYSRALDLAWEMGHPGIEASALSSLAVLHQVRGEYGESAECFERSLAIYRRLGKLPAEAYALDSFAELMLLSGDYGRAYEFLSRGLEISRDIGLVDNLACLHPKYARYCLMCCQLPNSTSFSLEPTEDPGQPDAPCKALETALIHLEKAMQYFNELGLGRQTEEGEQIEAARQAIMEFAKEHCLMI